jgi:hypothetical protein
MIRIGKYKYLIDLNEGANLDSVNSFFILEFEYDNKFYVGWTGETRACSVKSKIESLIYNTFRKSNWPTKNNPELAKAIIESKYITVSTEEIKDGRDLISIYSRMYELIDEYKAYSPYGHNIINSLNKCVAEKAIIPGYAAKWDIPDTIYRSGTNSVRSYPHRAVYQYKQISENVYKFYKKWGSIREYINSVAPMKINPSAIYMCCNGQRRIAYGDIWRFDNTEEIIEIVPDMRKMSTRNIEKEVENRMAKFKARIAKIQHKIETGKSKILG